jgi:hypothetical protein
MLPLEVPQVVRYKFSSASMGSVNTTELVRNCIILYILVDVF